MSVNSKIEWTHATVNFWWGCTEVSPACAFCYAREWAKFTSRQLFGRVVKWGDGEMRAERLIAARAEALKLNGLAEKSGQRFRVFANSMSDWLDDKVPVEWLAEMLRTIKETPHLDWQLLTKRPENWHSRIEAVFTWLNVDRAAYERLTPAAELVDRWFGEPPYQQAPANVWLGTTVEDQTRANVRIPALLAIPARIRFLSCEPLLGPVTLDDLIVDDGNPGERHVDCLSTDGLPPEDDPDFKGATIGWVICGGESGHHARPMPADWARSLRDQCAISRVPFFFKQWGEWAPFNENCGTFSSDQWNAHPHWFQDRSLLGRIGKKTAGRLLDGSEHNAFPA